MTFDTDTANMPDGGGSRDVVAPTATGRPTLFSQAVANSICTLIATGNSLRSICEADDMPGLTTVYRWLRMNEGFRHQYAHAREDMADTFGDQILKIADDDSLTPESRRLRIDTRKWLASKLAPKRYGDKLAVGGDEGNPIQIVTEVRRTYVKPGANNA